jgi:transmembrane sensor
MKKSLFEDITLELLIQYLDGTSDSKAKQTVEDWLKANQNNPVYFSKIKEAWNDLATSGELSDVVSNDWQKILKRIRDIDIVQEKNLTLHWYQATWIKIAAVFLLGLSIAGGIFISQQKNTPGSNKNNDIVYNELIVPKGQKSQLVLSDGSKIWVNAGSKLRFPNRFEGKIREVWLEGEAFFEVAKNKSKPFYVYTNDLKIKVLGTVFNVKAYSNDDYIETTLISGLVSLEKQHQTRTDKEIFLHPNHKAIYLKRKTTGAEEEIKKHMAEPLQTKKIMISEPVSTEQAISWKDGKLVFENETFENVAKKLELRYDVEIQIMDPALKYYKYTGVLKNISIEQAIKALELTAPFNYSIRENKIVISTKKNKHEAT